MKKILILLMLIFAVSACHSEEIYRIRVENIKQGLIQISLDKGKTYYAAGRVTRAAANARRGFLAGDYTPGGCVAAVSSHGIRMKISPEASHLEASPDDIKIFSLVPKELYTEPAFYGGLPTGDSGIHTDIHAATSIFANHAPFQGSRIYLEENGAISPLKSSYSPSEGDIIVIIAEKPQSDIRYIDFENKEKGSVMAVKADGSSYELTKVVRPVRGVGRFDGTSYDAPGQINTAHGGVITIASSPKQPADTKETTQNETRGGFMIQPWYHLNRHDETVDQVMVVGTVYNEFELEGKAPLYNSTVGLWYYPENLEKSFRALVKIDGGEWQNVPSVTGLAGDGFTAKRLKNSKNGVTDIRLCLPDFDAALSLDYLKKSAKVLTDRVIKQGAKPKSDIFVPEIPAELKGADYYTVFADGAFRGMGNEPEKLLIDTSSMPEGVHHLQIIGHFGNTEKKVSKYFLKGEK